MMQRLTKTQDNHNFMPELNAVIQSGVQTLIWFGDADAVCDWFGGFATIQTVEYSGSREFIAKELKNYTVDGEVYGMYKAVENLSFMRVFESGHFIPYFRKSLHTKP